MSNGTFLKVKSFHLSHHFKLFVFRNIMLATTAAGVGCLFSDYESDYSCVCVCVCIYMHLRVSEYIDFSMCWEPPVFLIIIIIIMGSKSVSNTPKANLSVIGNQTTLCVKWLAGISSSSSSSFTSLIIRKSWRDLAAVLISKLNRLAIFEKVEYQHTCHFCWQMIKAFGKFLFPHLLKVDWLHVRNV